jgi:hypothetical protein
MCLSSSSSGAPAQCRSSRSEDDRLLLRRLREQTGDCFEQQVALGLGLRDLGCGQIGDAARQFRRQSREIALVLVHVRREDLLGRVRHIVTQHLDEGLIRQVDVLVAGAEQDRRSFGMRRQRRLGGEPRLADFRLAGDQHQLPLPVLRLRPRRAQRF